MGARSFQEQQAGVALFHDFGQPSGFVDEQIVHGVERHALRSALAARGAAHISHTEM